MITATAQLRALVLHSGESRGPVGAVWRPCEDEDTILETDHEQKIYLPDDHKFYGPSYSSVSLPEATMSELRERYPEIHPRLSRMTTNTDNDYLHFTKDGESITEEEYKAAAVGEAKHVYSTILKSITIIDRPNRENVVYRGDDAETAAELCLYFGGSIRVEPPGPDGYRFRNSKPNAAIFRRNSGNDKAEDNAEILADAGCICREVMPGQYEIHHSPEKIARAAKAQATRSRNARARGTNGLPRHSTSLVVKDLVDVVRVFNHILMKSLDGFTTDWKLEMHSGRGPCRNSTVKGLLTVLETFNFVFGKNAHRRVGKFQYLLTQWRTYGVKTRSVWGNETNYYANFAQLWDFLDRESEIKKPRKGLLLNDMAIAEAANKRVVGLWDNPVDDNRKEEDEAD